MKPILSLLIFMIFSGCNFQETKESKPVALNGPELITELERLEFFNLTDQTEKIEVKAAFQKSFTDLNFFQGKLREESLLFMDNRYYLVDCEELFEVGGLTKYLNRVKPTFQKLGLQLEFENERSEHGDSSWTHTIELNGKKYVAFKGNFSDLDWAIAYLNFIGILNTELKRQGSTERFYPIRCGNDGAFVLLSPAQFEFIGRNYPHDNEHPTTINSWKTRYDL